MTPAYLYIHVPFCLRRCSYCDFAVTATREPPVDAWLDAVDAELTLLAREEAWAAPLELRTLYIGGGTPSLLGLGAMQRLRARLERHARWDDAAIEWTAEANPETLTPALAADWRAAGVNRISLGAQTFHEPTLRWMGRLHGADGPARAVGACRESGIDNVSVDLIFGLPARLGRDWDADLARAIALEPTHVSLYGLTAESGTPLGRWVAEGRERMVDEDAYAAEYLLAAERMSAAGFEHYEVSNFARPGRQSVHNGAYWTGAAYVGLGPGAHSFLPPERRWNERDWMAYRRALEEGRLPRVGAERIDADAARLESLWLGLRASAGVPLDRLSRDQLRLVERWVAEGWARPGDDRVRLTRRGWLLLDRLTVELDERAA